MDKQSGGRLSLFFGEPREADGDRAGERVQKIGCDVIEREKKGESVEHLRALESIELTAIVDFSGIAVDNLLERQIRSTRWQQRRHYLKRKMKFYSSFLRRRGIMMENTSSILVVFNSIL